MKMKLKQNNIQLLSSSIKNFFSIQEYKDILQFALEDVSLQGDISADKNKIDLENYPYMIEPLSKCMIQQSKRKEVVIAFPEQMGKTTIEMLAILYNTVYNTLQAIICYPSQQLAVQTSQVKFIPLFKKIEQFKEEIEKPFAIRGDRLKLSNAVIYWQGAGSKVVSKSAKLVLADQCSVWENPPNINNMSELKKRTRSYNECLQLFVSTPRYKDDYFWQQWLNGSQGYYYLRCMGCNQLTMRSADLHNLQFQSVWNEQQKLFQVISGTSRLVCPVCGRQHTEAERKTMVCNGGYLHKIKQKTDLYPTYQAGVLASLLNVHSWDNLADIQLASGKSASLNQYISFDNSIRGLPYQQREYRKQDETALEKHYYKSGQLKKEDIQAIYLIADTQDLFSVVGTFALTRQGNYYLMRVQRLRYLFLQDQQRKVINSENHRQGKDSEITVLDRLNQLYFGDIKPLMLFVDCRGHRTNEIKNFSRLQKNVILYAGTNLRYDTWKISENNSKMFLCDAKKLQAELIFLLYAHNNKQQGYLYLTDTLTDKDLSEIIAFQPDTEKRNGGLYENWVCGDKVHDVFDVLKMFLGALKISTKIYRKDRFLHGQAKVLNTAPPPKKAVQKKPVRAIPPKRKVFF